MSSYIIISAYTKNTPYEQESKKLEQSLINLKLEYKMYPMDNQGSWEKNCQLKAMVILQALNEHNKPVVWVDSDAIVFKEPVFFENNPCDFSCFFLKTHYNPNELLSGTLYFNNTEKAKSLIQDWIEMNKTNSIWDQKNLQSVYENKYKDNINWTLLPKEYIIINYNGIKDNGVICHYQASRRLKRVINRK